MFTFELIDRDGTSEQVFYDPHASTLVRGDGAAVVDRATYPAADWRTVADAPRVAPDRPMGKSRHIRRLKVQLGLSCNYSCSYCLQAAHVESAVKTSTRDAELFLKRLDSWMKYPDEVQRLELWGGEPLLYWHKLQVLVPVLKEKCPQAKFSIITNGSMLTDDIVDTLDAWGFAVGISHDGPGQPVRGPDPLESSVIRAVWQRAIDRLGPRLSINSVISPASYSVIENQRWFADRLSNVNLSYEGVVHDYDGDPNAKFQPDQLNSLTDELIRCMLGPDPLLRQPFMSKLKRTLDSFVQEQPSRVLGQKCGMDREDTLSVDLLGNVSTCQNTGTTGQHRIGSVQDFDSIRLDTATHWSYRPMCSTCPVLQLCSGSCMYQEGEGWVNSCRAEYAYNLAFLVAAVSVLTGKSVAGITARGV